LEERAQAFMPVLLVNQVRTAEHRRVGPELVATWRDRLGVRIEFAGSLDSDPNVSAAVAQRQPALQAFPYCGFSRHIDVLARRLLHGEGDAPRERAAERRLPPRSRDPAAPHRSLPPLDLAHPGAYLRRCREQLGFTLGEMIERTRIRVLDHIESERFELLPPEPYLKSYLFTYARELGVPEVAYLVASYLERLQCVEALPRATGTPAHGLRRLRSTPAIDGRPTEDPPLWKAVQGADPRCLVRCNESRAREDARYFGWTSAQYLCVVTTLAGLALVTWSLRRGRSVAAT
jgi:hypothetical protein